MGGGGSKGGGQCSPAGYAYFANFAYAFGRDYDELLEFWRGETVIWTGSNSSSVFDFYAQTGKTGDVQSSNTGKSLVRFYQSGQTVADPNLTSWSGYEIAYKEVCYAVFNQCFVGDNINQLPQYKAKLRKTEYHNNVVWEDSDGNDISTYDGDVNPAVAIYDLLYNEAHLSPAMMDLDSFKNVAVQLYKENLGVSFMLSEEKKVADWVQDILDCVDGVMYYSPLTGKYYLKLLRDDYDVDSLPVYDESLTKDIELTQSSWANVYTHFNITYVDQRDGKEKTISFVNNASLQVLGRKVEKNIKMPMISRDSVVQSIGGRYLAKYSRPFKQIKFKASFLDLPNLKVGDCFIFENTLLDTKPTVYRITKVSGDEDKSLEIEIEAAEDVFAYNKTITHNTATDYSGMAAFNFDISSKPTKYLIKDAAKEMSYGRQLILGCNKIKGQNELITDSMVKSGTGKTKIMPLYIYTTLVDSLPELSNTDPMLDRNFTFKVKDVYNAFYNITYSDSNLDNIKYGIYIEDEMIAFGGAKWVDEDSDGNAIYELKGVIRGLNDTVPVSHDEGTEAWIIPYELRKITLFGIEANSTKYSFAYHNPVETGEYLESSDEYEYKAVAETPYPPQVHKAEEDSDGNYILKWSPRVRLAGANYRSPDNITGGQDEGMFEGYYIISSDNHDDIKIDGDYGETLYTYKVESKDNYKIKCVIGDKESPYVDLEVGI